MTRIALAITRDRNRDLLASLFGEHDVVDIGDSVPAETDICVVDEGGFTRVDEALASWRADQHPTFTPVLLLTESSSDDPWEQYADALSERLDGIMQIPAQKKAITARIETLLQMREFSQLLSAEHQLTERIFDTSPLAMTVLDTEGQIIRANDRAEQILDLSESDLAHRTYDAPEWRIFDENGESIPSEELPFARVMETGKPVHGYEHGIERVGGEEVWLSINMAPIRDETGGIEYLVAAIEDITVQRDQEQELERQLDLFEKAQTIASVGAWEYEIRGDTAYWTDQVNHIHGLDPDTDPPAALDFEFFHPEDRPVIEAAFERAVEAGDPFDLELRLIDADDTQRWVQVRGEPQYEDGDLVRIRGTMQEITDRKERELELRQMTRAVDTAPIGIVLTDPDQEDNPLVYVNDGFVDMTGYSRAEATGRNCRFLQGANTNPDTVAQIRQGIDAEQPVSVVIRNYRADGTEFWNRLEIAPVRDDRGEVINYIGFQQDVTEQIERQQQLQTLDRYLRHNLRNKLNVVQGLAEHIHLDGEPPVTEFAETIEQTSHLLLENMEKARTITNFLREDPAVDSVDLGSVLRAIVEKLRDEYPDATISLSAPDGVAVKSVPQLFVALEELIVNAIDHNHSASPYVNIKVFESPDQTLVSIADDGPGIPDMEVDVLTGNTEETSVTHGQGLGLWLVYLIVRRSGATIDFADNYPQGSVVTISLTPDS